MAESKSFIGNIEAMFQGMEKFVSSKTVVGEPVKVDNAIIIPLVDISCGMGTGVQSKNNKEGSGGGMGAKMSPAAVLVIQNGVTKLVNVRNQDVINKALDMVPDLINRFTGKNEVSVDALAEAEKMAGNQ